MELTKELKIEIITEVVKKAKENINSLNQHELGIMTKLSYGAKLNDFTDDELKSVAFELVYLQ